MTPEDQREARYLQAGIVIWIVTFLIIGIMVFQDPVKRSVTPVYNNAVANWIQEKDLYGDGMYLFHYLPQFVCLYMPFYALGSPAGDIIWRGLSLSLLVVGIFMFIRYTCKERHGLYFLIATLLIITPSIGALRNGQANLLFAAICILLCLTLMKERWWLAALCLGGLVMVKQTGIIITLLALAGYRQLWMKVAVFAGLFAALPFLTTSNVDYAISQYRNAFLEMSNLTVIKKQFADINGLLNVLGLRLQGVVSILVRTSAGLLTLALWIYINRYIRQPLKTILLLSLFSAYLMLFHPMTEQNSYVIAAPAIAMLSVYLLDNQKHRRISILLMVMCVSLGVMPELVRRIAPDMGLWFKPLMLILFLFITLKIMKDGANQRA